MGLFDIVEKVFNKMEDMAAENSQKKEDIRRRAELKSDKQLVDRFRGTTNLLEKTVYGEELQRRRNEYSDAEREKLEELIRERGR